MKPPLWNKFTLNSWKYMSRFNISFDNMDVAFQALSKCDRDI